jgi:hypothetical protein
MCVEAAMGQPGLGHQPGNAGALNPFSAEFFRRHRDNMLPCGRLLALIIPHGLHALRALYVD